MKLLLYILNYSPDLIGIGKYNGEVCLCFIESGGFVRAFTE